MDFDGPQSRVPRSLIMNNRQFFLACITLSLQFSCVFSLFKCDGTLYGKPVPKDCFNLYNQLPGGSEAPDIDLDTPRSFVEPKFMQPSFSPVFNPFRTQMVQLPKVWREGL